ncbi:MAG: putative mitochondrial chaperone BCS1-A [Harvfovirus sp.]|uniref:Putative mitochondrial chaperone BCS1-A n=1 Tax=Harvfovirus sp. TaxID=2487768 RepID=A0A3G5A1E7_9VIRU|nr:MAG: putative mitochondrial chaperone BCS1-A [Harvfovirus sp.]
MCTLTLLMDLIKKKFSFSKIKYYFKSCCTIKIWKTSAKPTDKNSKHTHNLIYDFEIIDRTKSHDEFNYTYSFEKMESINTLCKWIFKTYPAANYGNKRAVILPGLKCDEKILSDTAREPYKSFKMFPIFQKDNDILFIHYITATGAFCLCCDKLDTLKETFEAINLEYQDKIIENEEDDATTESQIYECDIASGSTAFLTNVDVNKTFENLVFNKKKDILKIYSEFEANVVSKNIYVMKNLGILLHGPPGTGKTSFIKATCNYFKMDAVIIDFSRLKSKASFIQIYRDSIANERVLVLDEFDYLLESLKKNKSSDDKLRKLERAMQTYAKDKDEEAFSDLKKKYLADDTDDDTITIYTLLTLLDGLYEHKGRIIIATTNNPETLDKALLRPGRFDIKLKMNNFNKLEIKELLSKIFNVALETIRDYPFEDHVWSPAEIISIANIEKDIERTAQYLLAKKPDYFRDS